VQRAVAAPTFGGGAKVQVKGFRIAGVSAARAEALLPLLQRYVGADKSLADLEDAAKDVEVALQRQGLFLAQAYVPEQTLSDGIVTIQVLEGRIGAVKIELEPGATVSPEFLDRIVAILRGNPVAERELIERALFTLGDLRGISVSSSLTPGEKIGQADLTIKVAPGARFAANLDADNGGSIFTGKYRVNAGFDWFNPAGRGDIASLRAQVTTNLGAKFVRGSWLMPINSVGTKLGVAASFLKYELGTDTFKELDADGTAEAYSLQLLHPVIRSRNSNLFVQASTDYRRFEDRVQAIDLVTKKHISPYATLGVVGDFRDFFAGGGITNYSLGVVGGKLKIKNPEGRRGRPGELQHRRPVPEGPARREPAAGAADARLSLPQRLRPVRDDEPRQLREVQPRRPERRARLPLARIAHRLRRDPHLGVPQEPADRQPAGRDRRLGVRRLRDRPAAPAQARHRQRQHSQAHGPRRRRDLRRQERAHGQELRRLPRRHQGAERRQSRPLLPPPQPAVLIAKAALS
jgi:hypothetical protein